MGLLDYITQPRQAVAYLFPELDPATNNPQTNLGDTGGDRITTGAQALKNVFVFQYWPSQVSDTYTPNWVTKNIPGASHPLYQWVSGNGRDISFTAQFTSEISEQSTVLDSNVSFNERIERANAVRGVGADRGVRLIGAVTAGTLPSTRYTVNVAAAIASLQQYLYPTYGVAGNQSSNTTKPPRKLILVLPNSKLGRDDDQDGILCIMRQASVTMESFFPDGELRIASVSLKFSEIIQHSSGSASKIRYIGADAYSNLAQKYQINTPVAEGGGLFF
jgi:hypothetical protein